MSPDPISLLSPYLVEQCQVILGSENALGRAVDHAADPYGLDELVEVVHDVRVAIRRLRSTVRTFGPAFDEEHRHVLVTEGAWYANQLGALRDLDVIEERLTSRLDELDPDLLIGPVPTMITSDLASQRRAQRESIIGVLGSERYARLREIVQRWSTQPAWSAGAADVDIQQCVRKAKKRFARRRQAARSAVGSHAPDALHLMHQARKAAKRHRYAVEVAAPLIGERAESIVAKRKRQQDDLGLIQDSVVTADYLIGLARRLGNRSGRNVFTLGVLVAGERAVQREAQRAYTS